MNVLQSNLGMNVSWLDPVDGKHIIRRDEEPENCVRGGIDVVALPWNLECAENEAQDPVVDDAAAIQCLLDVHGFPSPRAAAFPQILQDFAEGFLPSNTAEPNSQAWLPSAIHLAHSGPDTDPATLSLRALAFVRVGYRWTDLRLVHAGQEAYGLALKALQMSLNGPTEAEIEGAIASCRFLTCYEMFTKNGNATEPHDNWTIHQAGLEQLLKVSGKRDLDDGLLQGTADMVMRRAIAARKAPQLKMGRTKRLEGQVWEIGTRFAGILGSVDAMSDTSELRGLTMRLVKLDQQLQSWYLAMSLTNKVATSEAATDGYTALRYSSLSNAQLIATHWALRILISSAISQTTTSDPSLTTEDSDSQISQLVANYSTRQRSEQALRIMRSAWYFASGGYNATGFIRYSFAYNHAVEALLEDPTTVAGNPWLKRLPLTLFSGRSMPIHGPPPSVSLPLRHVCTMSPDVKRYYGQTLTSQGVIEKMCRYNAAV